ncbi:MAG: UDP-3-O-acyl-N-acetylglucosamine deacetylase, partial [Myxococcales bacterium]|nr:UDP-3-O-acyl-N-acetylglucosamine deacetylase [Myxococcales bacterium]
MGIHAGGSKPPHLTYNYSISLKKESIGSGSARALLPSRAGVACIRAGGLRGEGVVKQRTVAEKVSCTGVGLHGGAPVQVTLLPARS